MTTRTAVATDSTDPIRRARLEWIASVLRFPAARVRQMSRQAGSLRHRAAPQRPDPAQEG